MFVMGDLDGDELVSAGMNAKRKVKKKSGKRKEVNCG
jgi:hypothetical protein